MIKEKLHVESVITSPPYWNMRDYEIEPSIWDGDPECEHDFEIRTKTRLGLFNFAKASSLLYLFFDRFSLFLADPLFEGFGG